MFSQSSVVEPQPPICRLRYGVVTEPYRGGLRTAVHGWLDRKTVFPRSPRKSSRVQIWNWFYSESVSAINDCKTDFMTLHQRTVKLCD